MHIMSNLSKKYLAIGNRGYTNQVRLRGLMDVKPAQAGFVCIAADFSLWEVFASKIENDIYAYPLLRVRLACHPRDSSRARILCFYVSGAVYPEAVC